MKPRRYKLTKANCNKLPASIVKVDRTTPWGNPYHVGTEKAPTAVEAVMLFRSYAYGNPVFTSQVRKHLRGKNLACWCKPGAPCHADVLLEIANE